MLWKINPLWIDLQGSAKGSSAPFPTAGKRRRHYHFLYKHQNPLCTWYFLYYLFTRDTTSTKTMLTLHKCKPLHKKRGTLFSSGMCSSHASWFECLYLNVYKGCLYFYFWFKVMCASLSINQWKSDYLHFLQLFSYGTGGDDRDLSCIYRYRGKTAQIFMILTYGHIAHFYHFEQVFPFFFDLRPADSCSLDVFSLSDHSL